MMQPQTERGMTMFHGHEEIWRQSAKWKREAVFDCNSLQTGMSDLEFCIVSPTTSPRHLTRAAPSFPRGTPLSNQSFPLGWNQFGRNPGRLG